jgi:hypothetical protein
LKVCCYIATENVSHWISRLESIKDCLAGFTAMEDVSPYLVRVTVQLYPEILQDEDLKKANLARRPRDKPAPWDKYAALLTLLNIKTGWGRGKDTAGYIIDLRAE